MKPVSRIRRWSGILMLVLAAFVIVSDLTAFVSGDELYLSGAIGVLLLLALPGFLLAFPRLAKRVPWGASIVGLAGIGIIIDGYAAWNSDRAFDENAVGTTAVLTAGATENCSESAQGASTCTWTAPVSFTVDNVEITGSPFAPPGALAGDALSVRYQPNDPNDFRSEMVITAVGLEISGSGGDWVYWILPIIGLGVLTVGVIASRQKIREQRGQNEPANT